MDAREAALLTLNACHRQGGWSDGVLKKQLAAAKLDSRDAALATQLCFGVLQNQLLLDFYLSQFSNIALSRMEGKVVQALRLGVYQMLFLDQNPPQRGGKQLGGDDQAALQEPESAGDGQRHSAQCAAEFGPAARHPQDRPGGVFDHSVQPPGVVGGGAAAPAGQRGDGGVPPGGQQPPRHHRHGEHHQGHRPGDGGAADGAGGGGHAPPLAGGLPCPVQDGRPGGSGGLRQGLFYVQDPASRLAVEAAEVRSGMRVLDCCAAPGGKSFAAGIAMKNEGELISCDIHPHKKKLLQAGADRLGLSLLHPMTADGKVFRPEWEGAFDRVLVDAPCSGLGVIRKKPDIRYKDPEPLEGLPQVQGTILENAAGYVKPNGLLMYSTCTILPRENQEVVDAFLQTHPEFVREGFTLPGPAGEVPQGEITLWPQTCGTDGFFICKLRKKEEGAR